MIAITARKYFSKGGIESMKPVKKPFVTKANAEKRLTFAG